MTQLTRTRPPTPARHRGRRRRLSRRARRAGCSPPPSGTLHHGEPARRRPPGRGRPGLHDGRDRLGRDPHRSLVRRPDRRPHPPDGGQLPHRIGRARVERRPRPRAGRHAIGDPAGRPRPVTRGAAGGGRDPGDRPGSTPARSRLPSVAVARGARSCDEPMATSERGRWPAAAAEAAATPAWDAVDHVSRSRPVTRSASLRTASVAAARCSSTTA